MESKVTRITPELAKAMIAATTSRNRSISKVAVKRYSEAMRAGRWQENGEPIIVDDNGNVIDGQHRLHAIILSGVTVQMVIVRGVSPSSFKTIDSGRKRRHSDLLGIEGFARTTHLAAIVGAVYSYEASGKINNGNSPQHKSMTYDNPLYDPVAETKSRMPRIYNSMTIGIRWADALKCNVSITQSGFMHYILGSIDQAAADAFFESMIDMNFHGKDDPAKRLHVFCRDLDYGLRMSKDSVYCAAIFIKAWNYYRKGEPCKFLRFSDVESFPIAV